jgi:hypothetical protein
VAGVPRIAACILTFNSARTIRRAVESVRAKVDEVVVYDTGSRDDTLPILEAVAGDDGAPVRVHRASAELELYPDGRLRDFAAARESSFSLASPGMDWLLWIDSDDEATGGADLHELAAAAGEDVDAFVALYDEGPGFEHWRERLVRRGRLRWQGRVHEVLRAPHAGGYDFRARWRRVEPAEFQVVHHDGPSHAPDMWKLRILRDVERDAEAAGEELDARTLYCLGDATPDPDEALGYMVRAALLDEHQHSAMALRDIAAYLSAGGEHWFALLVDGLAARIYGSVASIAGAAESLAALGYQERSRELAAQASGIVEELGGNDTYPELSLVPLAGAS